MAMTYREAFEAVGGVIGRDSTIATLYMDDDGNEWIEFSINYQPLTGWCSTFVNLSTSEITTFGSAFYSWPVWAQGVGHAIVDIVSGIKKEYPAVVLHDDVNESEILQEVEDDEEFNLDITVIPVNGNPLLN